MLISDDGRLTSWWPFVEDELRRRAEGVFVVRYQEVGPGSDVDLSGVTALALFGGDPNEDSLSNSALRVAGGVTESCGVTNIEWFWNRGVPWVEATAGWASSVAELALGLLISALRRIPYWHQRVVDGWVDWSYPYAQFCDDDRYVNGTIGAKRIGVVGLGAIGSRLASVCHHLGAEVAAFDPYADPGRFASANARQVTLDELVDSSQILVVAVPPTPSAVGMIDADRVARLHPGSIVVLVTRVAAVDFTALRHRAVRGELAVAGDVWDLEPLPADDPLRGLPNVVHTPHIGGRTRDANLAVARILMDDFIAVVRNGRAPQHALTSEQVRVRLGVTSLRHIPLDGSGFEVTWPTPRITR